MDLNLKRLNKNLRLLRESDPKTALQLTYVDPSDLIFCQTLQSEPNLKRVYRGKTYYTHDQNDAKKEAETWFCQLPLGKATVLYVYGLGLGYAYEAAKTWLKQDPEHSLVFLEDDLAVVVRFLETELATALLKDPQVKLCLSPNLIQDEALLKELTWSFVSAPFVVSALPFYATIKKELFLELHHRISYQSAFIAAVVDEYLKYGIVFFRNFYPNLLELPKASLGNALFGRFKDVPAIICGAGPSLNKNGELLRDIQDRALIFAGGSSLNALCAKGIPPHFGAGIDPNAMQHERIKANQQFATPFFYRNRFHHEALKAIRGPRLYLTGSGGYDGAAWVEQQLGIEGDSLDEGHNIVNFSVSIAQALGCNPIIFVGVDMAYTDMQSYAAGIIPDAHVTKKQLLETDDFDSQAVVRTDVHGKPIYTQWKWISESKWISDYAKEHSEIIFLNATEGGIGFEGIPNISLKEVIASHLKKRYPLKKTIQREIEEHRLDNVKKEQIVSLLSTLHDSLNRAVGYIDTLIEEVHKLEKKIVKEGAHATLETPVMTLFESDLADEVAYRYILDNFNMVFVKLSQRAIQSLTSGPKRLSEKQQQLKKLALHHKRLSFLKEVAQVNLHLLNVSFGYRI